MRQKHLKTCSKSQRGAVNSAGGWMAVPLPSRLPQATWWPETLLGLFLTSANYLDVSPCGTPAHTCKKNLWNTLDNDKLPPQPSYPLHQSDHLRQPSEKGEKTSLDQILTNKLNMQSIPSPPLKNRVAGFIGNIAAGEQKLLISATERVSDRASACVWEGAWQKRRLSRR